MAALLYSTLHSQFSPLRFLGLLSDFLTKGSTLIYWQIYNFWLSFEYSMFHFYNLLQIIILPTTNILFLANNKYLYFHANDEKLFFVMPSKKFRQFFLCQTKKCAAEKIFSRQEVFSTAGFFHLLLT